MGACELVAQCDNDERVRKTWKKGKKKKLRAWGDLGDVSDTELGAVFRELDILAVSPPCGDWSLAGRQRRRGGTTGGWLVDWLKVLQRVQPAFPKVILMEFIYLRGDAEF